jgi:hypothetical protein
MTRLTGFLLVVAAVFFWISWVLMPGVGVTDAKEILKLVSSQPRLVPISAALQLLSAGLFALAIPGLARRFQVEQNSWAYLAPALLALGACGDAADAVYHQLAYEMVRPGIDQAAMIPVMQRMQTVELVYLVPMISAFLLGSVALSIVAALLKIVPKWNPLLYCLALAVAVLGGMRHETIGVTGRMVGLTCLGLLSISVAAVGLALWKTRRFHEEIGN